MFRNTSVSPTYKAFIASVVALALTACGGSSGGSANSSNAGTTPSSNATLTKIDVVPSSQTLAQNATQQYVATGTYSDGSTKNLTTTVAWSSSSPAIASIDSTGLARGLSAGTTVIKATSGSVSSAGSSLTILAASVTLSRITISPATATLDRVGMTQQYTAVGTYSDNSQADLTNSVTWSSSNPAIASISNSAGSQGLATGIAAGTVSITAASNGTSSLSPATLTVNAPVLTSVTLNPQHAQTANGYSVQFKLQANYSDGTTQDVTNSATWGSAPHAGANPAGAATVSDTAPSKGLVKGTAVGMLDITASYQGQPAVTDLTVNGYTLSSVTVLPAPGANDGVSVPKGLSQQFTANGSFSSSAANPVNSQVWAQDVTNDVTWSVADNKTAAGPCSTAPEKTPVATISNIAGSRGLAFANSKSGCSTVSAAYTKTTYTAPLIPGLTQVTSANSNANATSTLKGAAAAVTSLQITSPTNSIGKGSVLQYAATANYSDGTNNDVASAVVWESMNTAVATIKSSPATATANSVAGTPPGQATGVTTGIASIRATLKNATSLPTATGQDLVVNKTLNVTAATLVSIGIDELNDVASGVVSAKPATVQIPKNVAWQLHAFGYYSDGSKQDLTKVALWASQPTTAASFPANNGVVKAGASPGSTNITASYNGVTSPTSATVPNLTVVDAPLTSIAVTAAQMKTTPANTAQDIAVGVKNQYKAVGSFTNFTCPANGSICDLTLNNVNWISSVTNVGSIDASGALTALAAGTTGVTATMSGVTSTPTVTQRVTNNALSQIDVTPTGGRIAVGTGLQYKAVATYADGTTQDVTTSVSWDASRGDQNSTAVASIGPNTGLASGDSPGSSTITAILNSVSKSVTLQVSNATLTSLAVTCPASTLPKGATMQCKAIGTFSDSTTQDLTSDPAVSWSRTGAIATAASGLVTGDTVGGAGSVTALATISGSTQSASKNITVQ